MNGLPFADTGRLGEVSSISGSTITLSYPGEDDFTIALAQRTQVIGAEGHTLVNNTDVSRLHLGDYVFIGMEAIPVPPPTPLVGTPAGERDGIPTVLGDTIFVARGYLHTMTGTLVERGPDYVDVEVKVTVADSLAAEYVGQTVRVYGDLATAENYEFSGNDRAKAEPGTEVYVSPLLSDTGELVATEIVYKLH